ncbi:hypothetical protein ACFY84_34515 [Streptomyces sp. NPDC012438]|uniref:hypothetical protein n=1 Tax=Streptomyces sp. NPDC012438 TaxID=3364833 RepID=UPI0036EC9FF7
MSTQRCRGGCRGAGRAEARADHRTVRALAGVTALASAVAAHCRAMAVREDLRLTGADDQALAAARAESYTARSVA